MDQGRRIDKREEESRAYLINIGTTGLEEGGMIL
jgi:hypothetical protein